MKLSNYNSFLQFHSLSPSPFNHSLNTNNTISKRQNDYVFHNLLQQKIEKAMQLNKNINILNNKNTIPAQKHKVNDIKRDYSKNKTINKIVSQMASKYNVDEKLIHSVIKHESNYNPKATSHAGAMGLMQLMPQTARGLGVKNAFDIKQNIEGGTKYLRQMLNRYNGNVKLALSAYNAGMGNVDKYGGIPPFKETQNYVKNILKDLQSKSNYV